MRFVLVFRENEIISIAVHMSIDHVSDHVANVNVVVNVSVSVVHIFVSQCHCCHCEYGMF